MTGLSIPPDHYLRPVVARVQDHLDGGTDNYIVDREFSHGLLAVAPWLPASVRINRAHGPRILDYFTQELGIDQVIDLGCGARSPPAVRSRSCSTMRRTPTRSGHCCPPASRA